MPRRYFTRLAALYGFGLSAFLILRKQFPDHLSDEKQPLVAAINSFLHLLLMPALALIPLLIAFGRPIPALGMLVPARYFWRTYGKTLRRRNAPALSSATGFSLLTYNLHAETQFLRPMLDIIRAANADIVGLQEVSFEAGICLEREFADHYPYRAIHPNGYGSAGQVVLSRFPIQADVYWRNHNIPNALGHQRVEIDVRGLRLVYYNTHPVHPGMVDKPFDAAPRAWETRDLLHRTAQEQAALLIAGDMNMSDESDDYRAINARYQDTFRAVGKGMGYSFPDWKMPQARTVIGSRYLYRLPIFLRLDFIFHSAHLRPLTVKVWEDSGGSDHRPVFATFEFIVPHSDQSSGKAE